MGRFPPSEFFPEPAQGMVRPWIRAIEGMNFRMGMRLDQPNGAQNSNVFGAPRTLGCSADFQSAVSPNCIRRGVGSIPRVGFSQPVAECNSALQRSAVKPEPNTPSPPSDGGDVAGFIQLPQTRRGGRADRQFGGELSWEWGQGNSWGRTLALRIAKELFHCPYSFAITGRGDESDFGVVQD